MIEATFLGTSSILFEDQRAKILTDGFVSRPGLLRTALWRIGPDERAVRAAIERTGAQDLAAVLCAHSHYDHALDAPLWASETGADLIGSASTANVGRGSGVPEDRLKVVADGERRSYGAFDITFFESLHSVGDKSPGTIDVPLVPPARQSRWRSDISYTALIEHPDGTILFHPSANFLPGMYAGRRAAVVYLGIGTLGRQPEEFVERYWRETVLLTGATTVVVIHWDNFFRGLDKPFTGLPRFLDDSTTAMARIRRLAAAHDVAMIVPRPWQTLRLFE